MAGVSEISPGSPEGRHTGEIKEALRNSLDAGMGGEEGHSSRSDEAGGGPGSEWEGNSRSPQAIQPELQK